MGLGYPTNGLVAFGPKELCPAAKPNVTRGRVLRFMVEDFYFDPANAEPVTRAQVSAYYARGNLNEICGADIALYPGKPERRSLRQEMTGSDENAGEEAIQDPRRVFEEHLGRKSDGR